ncbi:hypothetical protein KIL84_021296 [Mauremys mutica]|uniref:Uncharacterized protein n=1 Tax=Mauremys mutica TaxID=74926 RepID=A0A9D4AZC4_9SAUR|nr:hypothetical protein KIL84_020802 [Mauremys mutica]KAH1176562.1 hypothetical protein KIL84_021296 [Mauremys mutica]
MLMVEPPGGCCSIGRPTVGLRARGQLQFPLPWLTGSPPSAKNASLRKGERAWAPVPIFFLIDPKVSLFYKKIKVEFAQRRENTTFYKPSLKSHPPSTQRGR